MPNGLSIPANFFNPSAPAPTPTQTWTPSADEPGFYASPGEPAPSSIATATLPPAGAVGASGGALDQLKNWYGGLSKPMKYAVLGGAAYLAWRMFR